VLFLCLFFVKKYWARQYSSICPKVGNAEYQIQHPHEAATVQRHLSAFLLMRPGDKIVKPQAGSGHHSGTTVGLGNWDGHTMIF
jgi:hypothetical protein